MIRVNLLGLPKAKKRARIPAITLEGGRALIFLVVVLVAVAALQLFRYRGLQAEGVRLEQEVQTLEREKAELSRIRSEYETFSKRKDLLTKRINIIEALKAQQSGPVQLLSVLASAVSNTDSLWLTVFERSGQNITIEGIALNVKALADFMTRLQNTKAFSEVDLKETSQDTAVKETKSFIFTVTGQLMAPTPTI